MSGGPETPRGKPPINPTTPTARLAGTHVVQSSPHYTTTRRHSLYGTEDRVIIDPGSRIWKVGFSGEGRPRDVFYAAGKNGTSLWDLSRARDALERAEQDRLLEVNLERCLRSVFHQCVLPKLLLEHNIHRRAVRS
jgi:actin-related protein 10